jgi:hypothetical protein
MHLATGVAAVTSSKQPTSDSWQVPKAQLAWVVSSNVVCVVIMVASRPQLRCSISDGACVHAMQATPVRTGLHAGHMSVQLSQT